MFETERPSAIMNKLETQECCPSESWRRELTEESQPTSESRICNKTTKQTFRPGFPGTSKASRLRHFSSSKHKRAPRQDAGLRLNQDKLCLPTRRPDRVTSRAREGATRHFRENGNFSDKFTLFLSSPTRPSS